MNFLLSDALALILSRANLDIINWKAIFHVKYLSGFYLNIINWKAIFRVRYLSGFYLNIINWKGIFHVRYFSVFYLFSWLVTVLDEGCPADCNSHILGSLAVLDEAVLYVVLLTVFFLVLYIVKHKSLVLLS